ncbi:MAG TPA: lipase maturation factor family protein, partial [Kofleriaceae bacterium]
MADSEQVDVVTPLGSLRAWLGPARRYVLTRWLILRLLGVVYLFAFLGIVLQGLPLLGEHGLTPAAAYVDGLRNTGMTFWDVPSIFLFDASDGALRAWALVGLALSAALVVGYANLPSLAALWLLYGSYERIGQLWWGFGWEIQLLETTVIAACLVHPWDPRPLRAPAPPPLAIVLMRWLAFRIMLGAGLIKLRGDACWTELTCLDAHFETQPIPNPLSPLFHHLPHAVLAAGVVVNHIVEVALPWFAFGPRWVRLVAAFGMAGFQIVLIASGNLAFLNWLTLIPVLALFDDDALVRLVPRRLGDWLRARMAAPARDRRQLVVAFSAALATIIVWRLLLDGLGATTQVAAACVVIAAAIAAVWRRPGLVASPGARLDGHHLLVACIAALVACKSIPVVANLAAHHQAMNRSYDRLALVNTYGAFGSVGMVRNEIVLEGTRDADPETARWSAYELPCKPGDLARRPCLLGPYHLRLDWLIWFAAMHDEPRDPWVLHVVWKLLDGDRAIRRLLAVDPFDGAAPRWVRIRRFVYHLEPYRSATWWTRDQEQL